MPKFENYFVVEYRYPVKVEDVSTVQAAMSKANRICERMFGFKPDNWFARIFEYSTRQKDPGLVKEYFYNPNSLTYREITKNFGYFTQLLADGKTPDDVVNYEEVFGRLESSGEVKIIYKEEKDDEG